MMALGSSFDRIRELLLVRIAYSLSEHKNESEEYNVYLPRQPESEGGSLAVATA